jgi:uncharacterized protein YjdB
MGTMLSFAQVQNIDIAPATGASTLPVIDANVDAVWLNYTAHVLTKEVKDQVLPDSSDCFAQVRVMWSTDSLYLLVEVTDDTIATAAFNKTNWDNTEIYFDMDNSKGGEGTYPTIATVSISDAADATTIYGGNSAYRTSATGYVIEVAIPFSGLMADFVPSDGTVIGFDIAVGDNDMAADLKKSDILFWNSTSGTAWKNESLLGELTFTGEYEAIKSTDSEGIITFTDAPVIDGVIDAIWEGITAQNLTKEVKDQILPSTTDCSATFKTTWSLDSLYILVEVQDDTIATAAFNKTNWDNTEIYFDMDNSKGGEGNNPIIATVSISDSADATTIYGGNSAYTTSATGYIIEVAIPFKGLMDGFVPAAGDTIGFDISVGDNDMAADLKKTDILFWNSNSGKAWKNESLLGELVFTGGMKKANSPAAMAATGAPVIDGDVDVLWEGITAHNLTKEVKDQILPDPTDCSATFKTMWSLDSLYILVEVQDDTIATAAFNASNWDNTEIYFDMDNSKGGEGNNPIIATVSITDAADATTIYGGNSAYKTSATGYVIEVAIPFSGLLADFVPSDGTVIGFDVAVGDNDMAADLKKTDILFWNSNSGKAWKNESLLGELTFTGTSDISAVIQVESVSIAEALTLVVGDDTTIMATILPAEATDKTVSWSSDNIAVATVVDGLISAIAPGTANIKVTTTDGSLTDICVVTVESATAISGNQNTNVSVYVSNELLYIKGIDIADIEIYNTNGRKVISAPNTSNSLNIQGLQSGIYFIKINGVDKVYKVAKF